MVPLVFDLLWGKGEREDFVGGLDAVVCLVGKLEWGFLGLCHGGALASSYGVAYGVGSWRWEMGVGKFFRSSGEVAFFACFTIKRLKSVS